MDFHGLSPQGTQRAQSYFRIIASLPFVTTMDENMGMRLDVASRIPTGLASPSSLRSVVFASSQ